MYEALYRKYRPRTFDDVVGQEYITETLKNQVRTGRLSHAYLFIGTRGTGKTTCARILAKAVNCEHPVNGNPCNECAACRGIEDGSILDVVELDAASNNGVDDVRMLRDEAIFSPTTVRKRVYIIDEVHMLSKSAFNALLKILEEPPSHLVFILATTELNKVLPTILSRCQRHSFRRLDAGTVAKRLSYVARKESINLEPDAAKLLGRLADGSMRDGLSLLDQCASGQTVDISSVLHAMGLAGTFRTQEMVTSVLNRDTAGVLEQYSSLWQDGKDPSALLGEMSGFFRDALLLRLAPKGGLGLISGAYGEDSLRGVKLSNSGLLWILNTIQRYQSAMQSSANPRLQGELCLIELCGTGSATISAPSPAADSYPEISPLDPPPLAAPIINKSPVMPTPAPPEPIRIKEEERPVIHETTAVENASEPVLPAGDFSWPETVLKLQSVLKPGPYNLISDPTMAIGELQGDQLVLRLATGLCYSVVNTPEVINSIRQMAARLLGKPVTVRVEALTENLPSNQNKLDMLGQQFSNVTIR